MVIPVPVDHELEIQLSRNLSVRLQLRPAYNTLSVSLWADRARTERPSRMYAGAEARLGELGHLQRTYLTHLEGEDAFTLWIGDTNFRLPLASLAAVRAFVPLDFIEYDAKCKRIANTPAGGARIAEAG
ncbi:MAG: hypothetical protein ACREP7_00545 [Lysobacter sp.]